MMVSKLTSFFKDVKNDGIKYFLQYPENKCSILDNDPERFEIGPEEFLEYAIRDFEVGDNRGFINALTNVKRAIECQSDIIHYSLGIPYDKLNFPTKIDNIQKMGISPSIILKHINNIRVDLEHFYKIPDNNRVEDAIQIAELYFSVTTLTLNNFWYDFEILTIDGEKRYSLQEMDESTGSIFRFINNGVQVYYSDEPGKHEFLLTYFQKGEEIKEIIVKSDDGIDYLNLIGLSVAIGKTHNYDGERIFQQFLSKLGS